jgi:hypothetical protein
MTIAALKALCSRIPWCEPAVLESVLELALEIAREGREGRRIGTLFTVGKADEVLAASRALILDPSAAVATRSRGPRPADKRSAAVGAGQRPRQSSVDAQPDARTTASRSPVPIIRAGDHVGHAETAYRADARPGTRNEQHAQKTKTDSRSLGHGDALFTHEQPGTYEGEHRDRAAQQAGDLARAHQDRSVRRAFPTQYPDIFAFEGGHRDEERSNLLADALRECEDIRESVEAACALRYRDDAVVTLAAVALPALLIDFEHAERSADYHDARCRPAIRHNQRVQGVAVSCRRAGDKAPIVGVHQTGWQRSREHHRTQLRVVFQFH